MTQLLNWEYNQKQCIDVHGSVKTQNSDFWDQKWIKRCKTLKKCIISCDTLIEINAIWSANIE